jgi:hypothetical protein
MNEALEIIHLLHVVHGCSAEEGDIRGQWNRLKIWKKEK